MSRVAATLDARRSTLDDVFSMTDPENCLG